MSGFAPPTRNLRAGNSCLDRLKNSMGSAFQKGTLLPYKSYPF